jgi:hypothetical protein
VISLEAVGVDFLDRDFIISLFKAYQTLENNIFLLEVRMLKTLFDRVEISSSKKLMESVRVKFDKLAKTNQWKASKP